MSEDRTREPAALTPEPAAGGRVLPGRTPPRIRPGQGTWGESTCWDLTSFPSPREGCSSSAIRTPSVGLALLWGNSGEMTPPAADERLPGLRHVRWWERVGGGI